MRAIPQHFWSEVLTEKHYVCIFTFLPDGPLVLDHSDQRSCQLFLRGEPIKFRYFPGYRQVNSAFHPSGVGKIRTSFSWELDRHTFQMRAAKWAHVACEGLCFFVPILAQATVKKSSTTCDAQYWIEFYENITSHPQITISFTWIREHSC